MLKGKDDIRVGIAWIKFGELRPRAKCRGRIFGLGFVTKNGMIRPQDTADGYPLQSKHTVQNTQLALFSLVYSAGSRLESKKSGAGG